MKNVVSYETAVRLKNAGFPQPDYDTGQFWYNDLGFLSFVGRMEKEEKTGEKMFYCTSVETGRTDLLTPVKKDAFFAPTATDILAEMPEHNIEFWQPQGIFYVENESGMQWVSENPAEAAAAAWLAKNETNETV